MLRKAQGLLLRWKAAGTETARRFFLFFLALFGRFIYSAHSY